MHAHFSSPRVFLLLLIILGFHSRVQALNGIQYNLTTGTSAFSSIGTATTVINANVDDQLAGPFSPVGFQFSYGGVAYTSFFVSSNGFIALTNPGSALPTNNLSTGPRTIIAPLWDDLATGASGRVSYVYSLGTLIVEWNNMRWAKNAAAPALNFQARLVPATGNIVFSYQQLAGAVDVSVSGGASIGLTGYCDGDYYSQTASSVQTAGTTWGKSVLFNSISTKPTTNQTFTWAPSAYPTPAHDSCANAVVIPFNPGSPTTLTDQTVVMTRRQTYGAGIVGGAPAGIAAQSFSNDVWYTFTMPVGITSAELLVSNTCPTGFSTAMAVYTGGCGALTLVGADESSNGGGNPRIRVNRANCSTSQQYWVRIESDQDALMGNFNLTLLPPGSTCATANDITCWYTANGSYNTTTLGWTMNNAGVGDEVDTPAVLPSTRNLSGQDYIFQFTPPAAGCFDLSLFNTTANTNPGIFVYFGCPGLTNLIGYQLGAGGTTLNLTNLALGTGTYYIVVDNDTSTALATNFAFSIQNSSAAAPSNDACASAQSVTPVVGSSCTSAVNYSVSCATPSPAGLYPNPGCAGFVDVANGDVWFTMTSISSDPHLITIQPGSSGTSATDLGMAIYTGNCASMTLIACDDNSAGSGMPRISVLPPSLGTVYYLRIWSNSGGTPGTFRICAISGCSPANDFCSGATPLVLGVNTSFQSNVCASAAGASDGGVATCWDAGTLNTVWYTVIASSTSIKIRTRLRTLTDSQIAVYSGTCGNLTQIGCNDNFTLCSSGGGRNSNVTVTGLTAGNTYYIRVDGRNAATGTFDIMAIDGSSNFPPIPDQDCEMATAICTRTNSIDDPGYTGSGNICDLQTGTCLASAEASGVWYTFSTTATTTGQTLQFSITPNNGFSNYDFQLWEVTGINNPCSLISSNPTSSSFRFRSCNYSSIGTTGLNTVADTTSSSQGSSVSGGWNSAYNLTSGTTQTFMLLVSHFDNYMGGSTSGFQLTFPIATPLNIGSPTVQYWKSDAVSSTWAPAPLSSNWDPSCLTSMGTCAGGPSTIVIQPGPNQPIIAANTSVKNLIVNAGATLTINPGITLSVCGDFTINGNISCGAGSTIQFIGNANQSVTGNLTGGNALWHCTMAKAAGNVTLGNNLDIRGNLTLNAGGTWLPNAKHIRLAGDFINNNGAASHGTALGSCYEFNGGANQNFNNLTSSLELDSVIMNQTGPFSLILGAGAFNDLNIGVGAYVAGTSPTNGNLVLTQGKIVTGTRQVYVRRANVNACTVGNNTSYVEGNLRRALATGLQSWDFPVGISTKGYQRAQVQFSAGPVQAYDLTCFFTGWSPPSGPQNFDCNGYYFGNLPALDNGYWAFNASIGSGSGTYSMRLFNNNTSNASGARWTIMKSTASPTSWSLQGTCDTTSTVSLTRRTGMTSFNATYATAQGSSTFSTPTILSFTPDSGAVGSLVTISGTGFNSVQYVRFNGVSATYSVPDSSTILATVPAGATTGTISISTPGGIAVSDSIFHVIPPPVISSFSPSSGPVGSTVILNGVNFNGAFAVTLNGSPVSFSVINSNQVSVLIGASSSSGVFEIATPGGSAVSAGVFTVIPPPAITSFSPTSGPIGTQVIIQGSGFTGATIVSFNGTTASFLVNNNTQITTTVPAGATSGPISIVTPGGSVNSASPFTVIPPPIITSFTPGSGPVTTTVNIFGNHFNGCTSVKFNGTNGSFTVISNGQLNATVPSGATTGYITITTPGGTATSTSVFSVTTPPLVVNIRAFIQGYYLGNGTMNAAVSQNTADNFILRLANATPPHTIAYSAAGTLDINGYGNFTFFGPTLGSSWYIVLQQRNTLETWSASPVTLTGLTTQYDFTTNANKAYGNNQVALSQGYFGIWSGDVNQDGIIESSDYSVIENDVVNFTAGYYSSDLTGDNLVESSDYSLIENNLLLFLFTVQP